MLMRRRERGLAGLALALQRLCSFWAAALWVMAAAAAVFCAEEGLERTRPSRPWRLNAYPCTHQEGSTEGLTGVACCANMRYELPAASSTEHLRIQVTLHQGGMQTLASLRR